MDNPGIGSPDDGGGAGRRENPSIHAGSDDRLEVVSRPARRIL